MKSVAIPSTPPRDPHAIEGFDPSRGLRPCYFTAIMLTAFTILTGLSIVFPPRESSLIMFKGFALMVLSCLSVRYARTVTQKRRARMNALRQGRLFKGKVISVSRIFVPWKSARDYRFLVETGHCGFRQGKTSFQTFDITAAEAYLPNTEIEFLYNARTEAFYFPAESGYRLATVPSRKL